MRFLRLTAALALCAILLSLSWHAHAESAEAEGDYNFTCYAVKEGRRPKAWTSTHDYTLFFDFEHDIAVLCDYHRFHYDSNGKKSTQSVSLFRMEQDRLGVYTLYDIDGEAYRRRFGKETKGDAASSSPVITQYTDGENSGTVWKSYKVKEQPVITLEALGFYDSCPTLSAFYGAFSDPQREAQADTP